MWAGPAVIVALLVFVMTLIYLGSIVDPVGHLHGLPVSIVDEDVGAHVASQRLDLGAQVAAGLSGSPAVSDKLSLQARTLPAVKARMDLGKDYTAVVIPPDFTASLLAIAGASVPAGRSPSLPRIQLLTNPRAGTRAVSLATGVLQPALARASVEIGQDLSGLSAFYISLLITMCGFLAAVTVNGSVDAALGYATTEIGPWWRQLQPVAISRWQTLLAKWVIATVLTVVLTSLMLLVAVGILGMNAPHFGDLWLLVGLRRP